MRKKGFSNPQKTLLLGCDGAEEVKSIHDCRFSFIQQAMKKLVESWKSHYTSNVDKQKGIG